MTKYTSLALTVAATLSVNSVATSTEETATLAKNDTYRLSVELWQLIARFCVKTHAELRTVYDVSEDLSLLQCVCKSSSECAAGLWPSVAQLCDYGRKQLAEQRQSDAIKKYFASLPVLITAHKPALDTNLEAKLDLPTEMLTIYIQVYTDKAVRIRHDQAKIQYCLTTEDLQTCKSRKIGPRGRPKAHMKQARQEASRGKPKAYMKQVCQEA